MLFFISSDSLKLLFLLYTENRTIVWRGKLCFVKSYDWADKFQFEHWQACKWDADFGIQSCILIPYGPDENIKLAYNLECHFRKKKALSQFDRR